MLFKPTEVSGAADELAASTGHPRVVLRASGSLSGGVRDFEFALDSTIESAYFFISLQCLESVAVLRPSGEELRSDAPEARYQAFEAIRLVTMKAPTPGTWKVSIAGRGFFSIIVKAKSDLTLEDVALTQDAKEVQGLAPLGSSVRLALEFSGPRSPTAFHFISMDGELLHTFAPGLDQEMEHRRLYTAEITLPTSDFRVLVTGIDEKGFSFQRVTPRLFVGE